MMECPHILKHCQISQNMSQAFYLYGKLILDNI